MSEGDGEDEPVTGPLPYRLRHNNWKVPAAVKERHLTTFAHRQTEWHIFFLIPPIYFCCDVQVRAAACAELLQLIKVE